MTGDATVLVVKDYSRRFTIFEIERGDETIYRAIARHWTLELIKQHKEMGFEGGWGASADQLKALTEAVDCRLHAKRKLS